MFVYREREREGVTSFERLKRKLDCNCIKDIKGKGGGCVAYLL
jgi:hypothetical protein